MSKIVRMFSALVGMFLLSACVVTTEESVYIEKFGWEDPQLSGVWQYVSEKATEPSSERIIITDIGDGIYIVTNTNPSEKEGVLRLMRFSSNIIFTFESFETAESDFTFTVAGVYQNDGKRLSFSILDTSLFDKVIPYLEYTKTDKGFLSEVVLTDTKVNVISFILEKADNKDVFDRLGYVRVR